MIKAQASEPSSHAATPAAQRTAPAVAPVEAPPSNAEVASSFAPQSPAPGLLTDLAGVAPAADLSWAAPTAAPIPAEDLPPGGLALGATGPEVALLQDRLVEVGLLPPDVPRGTFGPMTQGALLALQAEKGVLLPDGSVPDGAFFGEATLAALTAEVAAARVDDPIDPSERAALGSTKPEDAWKSEVLGQQFPGMTLDELNPVQRERLTAVLEGVESATALLREAGYAEASPELVCALLDAEGGFQASSYNQGSDARGIAQFLPSTWQGQLDGGGWLTDHTAGLTEAQKQQAVWDPRLAIPAAMAMGLDGLATLDSSGTIAGREGGQTSKDLSPDALFRYLYATHHDGAYGATRYFDVLDGNYGPSNAAGLQQDWTVADDAWELNVPESLRATYLAAVRAPGDGGAPGSAANHLEVAQAYALYMEDYTNQFVNTWFGTDLQTPSADREAVTFAPRGYDGVATDGPTASSPAPTPAPVTPTPATPAPVAGPRPVVPGPGATLPDMAQGGVVEDWRDTAALQSALVELGLLDAAKLDGHLTTTYGDASVEAVTEVQRRAGLPETGALDAATRAALDAELAAHAAVDAANDPFAGATAWEAQVYQGYNGWLDCGPSSALIGARQLGLAIPGQDGSEFYGYDGLATDADASAALVTMRDLMVAGPGVAEPGVTTFGQIQEATNALGATTMDIAANPEAILGEVQAGHPVVLLGRPNGESWANLNVNGGGTEGKGGGVDHFVVVSGFDAETGRFIVNDPAAPGPKYVTPDQLQAFLAQCKQGGQAAAMMSHSDRLARVPELSTGTADPDNVEALQDALQYLGALDPAVHATGPGLYGEGTTAALARFQAEQGLPATGQFDARTRQAMSAALAEKEATARAAAGYGPPTSAPGSGGGGGGSAPHRTM